MHICTCMYVCVCLYKQTHYNEFEFKIFKFNLIGTFFSTLRCCCYCSSRVATVNRRVDSHLLSLIFLKTANYAKQQQSDKRLATLLGVVVGEVETERNENAKQSAIKHSKKQCSYRFPVHV